MKIAGNAHLRAISSGPSGADGLAPPSDVTAAVSPSRRRCARVETSLVQGVGRVSKLPRLSVAANHHNVGVPRAASHGLKDGNGTGRTPAAPPRDVRGPIIRAARRPSA